MRFVLIFLTLAFSVHAHAAALNYSGRLVNADGSPVSGPVNLRFEVFYLPNTSLVICSKELTGVSLSQGVFHTKLNFSASDCGGSSFQQILTNAAPTDAVAIRVTDLTPTIPKVYGFQTLDAMPYTFVAEFAKTLGAMGATSAGQVLRWNGSQWVPDTIDEVAPASIGSSELADNSVTSAKIVDLTITGSDIAENSVAQSKITGLATSFAAKENALGVATASDYLAGDRAWRVFQNDVRDTFMGMGYSPIIAGGAIATTDTLVTAIAKLDGRITNAATAQGDYVLKAGDSMTGALILNADPSVALGAATKQYVDAEVGAITSSQWSAATGGINYAGGNVGVGTTAPAQKLHLNSSTATSTYLKTTNSLSPGGVDFGVNSVGVGVVYQRDNFPLILGTNNLERLRIDAVGNVGIGTTAPGARLEVAGQIKITGGSPGVNKILTSADATGLATWVDPPSTTPTGTAGGDLDGTYPNPTIRSGAVTIGKTNFADGDIPQVKVANLVTDLAAKIDDTQLDTNVVLGIDNTKIPSQAAVKSYIDTINTNIQTQLSGKLSLSGGTLTGPLVLFGAPTLALHAATKQYVDDAMNAITSPYSLSASDGTPAQALYMNALGNASLENGSRLIFAGPTETLTGSVYAQGNAASYVIGNCSSADCTSAQTYANFNYGGGLFSLFGMRFHNSQTGTAAAPAMYFGTDSTSGLFRPAVNVLAISTAGTERFRVTATGNVGIATSNPSALLEIPAPAAVGKPAIYVTTGGIAGTGDGSIGFYGQTNGLRAFAFGDASVSNGYNSMALGRLATASGNQAVALGHNLTSTSANTVAIGEAVDATANKSMVIGNGGGNRLVNSISNSIMLGMNSDLATVFVGPGAGTGTTGNVGIGTTTPAAKLDVAGSIKIGTSSTCTATQEGTQRYNSTLKDMEFCDGSNWRVVGSSSSAASPVLSKGMVEVGAAQDNSQSITLTAPGVLVITGWGRVTYSGAVSNAGTRVTVSVNGTPCASDFSFEGETSSVQFDSTATCILSLPAGTHTLLVTNLPSPGTRVQNRMSWLVVRE